MGQLLNNTLGLQGTVEVLLNLGTLNSSAATGCWVPECVNWWTYSLSLGPFSESDVRYLSNPRLMTTQETVFSIRKELMWISIQHPPYLWRFLCVKRWASNCVVIKNLNCFFFILCTCWLSADRRGAQNSPKHRLSSRKCLSY